MDLRDHDINKDNKSFIGGWYTDPKLCDEIVKYFDKASEDRSLPTFQQKKPRNYLGADLLDIPKPLHTEYLANLFECITNYKKIYPHCRPSTVGRFELYKKINIQRYEPDVFYEAEHCERSSVNVKRMLVFLTYLNDIEGEGGGTRFVQQDYNCKPEKGLTLIWPAEWTHAHVGIPCTQSQRKYIITGWFNMIEDPMMIDLSQFRRNRVNKS